VLLYVWFLNSLIIQQIQHFFTNTNVHFCQIENVVVQFIINIWRSDFLLLNHDLKLKTQLILNKENYVQLFLKMINPTNPDFSFRFKLVHFCFNF
jgi:hypothetical protein